MSTPSRLLIIGAVVGFGVAAVADDHPPLRAARSDSQRFELRIEPGRAGRGSRNCQATLLAQAERRDSERRVWQRPLVNRVAPEHAFVRDDGRFVVTLDEYERGGARHALVVYGADGELLRHFLLQDLLSRDDWRHVRSAPRSVRWLDGAEFSFDERANHFVIKLKWGRTLRVDLKRLCLLRDGPSPATDTLTGIPAEILGVLLASDETGPETAAASQPSELATLSPDEQARTAEIAASLTRQPTSRPAGRDVAASQPSAARAPVSQPAALTEPAPASQPSGPPGQVPPDTADAEDAEDATEPEAELVAGEMDAEPTAGDLPSASQPGHGSVLDLLFASPPDGLPPAPPEAYGPADWAGAAVETLDPSHTAGLLVPWPDPAEPVDYLAWVNAFGHVAGPDAAPLYQAALAALQNADAQADLVRDAARGLATAIENPELQAWLADNRAALETFRQASRLPERSWELHSDEGDLMSVVLPDLQPMRVLSRAVVAEGRMLAAEGEGAEASMRYLDALAAAGHVRGGYTLIEDLVGVAMEASAAEAMLDLIASPAGAELDYAGLVVDLEDAYLPGQSGAQRLQGERAMFLDTAQRMWNVDPETGACSLNEAKVREYAELIGEANVTTVPAQIEALRSAGYDGTVAVGNAYYDAITMAFELPGPQATESLAELDEMIEEDSRLVLKTLVPSLSHYHQLRQRSETTRRATVLVAGLQAYFQEHGSYPDSLDAVAGADLATDPFGNTPFMYRRVGDDFVLYSVGSNATDDAGTNDPTGKTNDLVFWPRPR